MWPVLLRVERLKERLEVGECFQVNLVAVGCGELFAGEADGVLGDGWVLGSVGAACQVGPRGVDKRMILSRAETVFLTVEGGQSDF
jgi:hypothetical protein